MVHLTPHELELYLEFFNLFDQLLIGTGTIQSRTRNSKASPSNVILNHTSCKNSEKLERQYSRAKSGHTWLDESAFRSIREILKELGCPEHLRNHLKSSYEIYLRVKAIANNSNYWAGSYLSEKSVENHIKKLADPDTLEDIFSTSGKFDAFFRRISNNGVLTGEYGTSLTNIFVVCEYVTRKYKQDSSINKSDLTYQDALLKLTRMGAFMSQTIGQWERFNYFKSRTNLLAKHGNTDAKGISLEHSRHFERYNRIIGVSNDVGSAAKSLKLAIDTSHTGRLKDIDLITLINAVDEFAEIGYSSNTSPHCLNGIKLRDILLAVEEIEKEVKLTPSQQISILLVTAEQANSDGKYEDAERLIESASLKSTLIQIGSHKRSIAFIMGKIEASKGNLDNDYFETARKMALDAGAIHIIRDIDNRKNGKNPYL